MTANNEPHGQWLTQEAYDRLSAELEHLSGPARAEVVSRIAAAREEGDLKENGGYHAAKEEQGKIEARIRQLTALLENAEVGEMPADDGLVEPGKLVVAEIAGDKITFLFGNREIAIDDEIEVYGETSPLGVAINGQKVGETITYQTPNGRDIKVNILSAKPFTTS